MCKSRELVFPCCPWILDLWWGGFAALSLQVRSLTYLWHKQRGVIFVPLDVAQGSCRRSQHPSRSRSGDAKCSDVCQVICTVEDAAKYLSLQNVKMRSYWCPVVESPRIWTCTSEFEQHHLLMKWPARDVYHKVWSQVSTLISSLDKANPSHLGKNLPAMTIFVLVWFF